MEFICRYETPAPERVEVDGVTYVAYADEPELRRDAHVITSQEHQQRQQPIPSSQPPTAVHQRFSPHESHQPATRYGASPSGTPAGEYEAQAMVGQAPEQQSAAAMHLSPSDAQNYSPPLQVLRPPNQPAANQQQQQHHLVAYADGTTAIKYSAGEVIVSPENLKASSTYTTLETVPLPPPQTPYTQYIATSESFQQPGASYSGYPKHQEIYIYPPSSQPSRCGEVRQPVTYTFCQRVSRDSIKVRLLYISVCVPVCSVSSFIDISEITFKSIIKNVFIRRIYYVVFNIT